MSTTIASAIDIDATPDAVWAVLTDFPAYADWNPFMDRVEGAPEVGSRLVVHMTGNGGKGITFKLTVKSAVPGHELRWLGKLAFGGLFDGEHFFELTPNADGSTRLAHGEAFSGVLVSLLKGTMKNTDAGFDVFNQALKRRVEVSAIAR